MESEKWKYQKKYRKKNKEKIRKYSLEYYRQHKEELRAYRATEEGKLAYQIAQAKYRESHREELRANSRRHYQKNKEKIAETRRALYKKKKELNDKRTSITTNPTISNDSSDFLDI